MGMNHVLKPQEETLGYYFQSGTCLVALETHDLLRILRSVVCKWPVFNITLMTLKIATQNTRLMGYFPIVLMKLFELHMFKLDLNTHQFETSVGCISAGQSYLCYIFYEIAYYDFIDYILE